ncbi:TPT-domain-containing protein [Annulohypoxylon stygium]|nr:TPT-domain-containing protein [Annulohypoxylon stygium]
MPPTIVSINLNGFSCAALWIIFSNATILFNKWLINDTGFPILLTCWHMIVATLLTQVLARKTTFLDSRHKANMAPRLFTRTILPIGILYSGSMIFNNLVYLHLSVPFIQMLKATGPIVTLIVGYVWGIEHPTWSKFGHILLIVIGVAMASAGEIHFSWLGTFFQMTGILLESIRVISIQSLLSNKGLEMEPLVLLYYYAPVCAIANFFLSLPSEWGTFRWAHVVETGPWILTSNALVAFMLNIFGILLIGKMSALVYVLLSVLKNIILVGVALAIWHTPIVRTQLIGYSLALIGLCLYQLKWEPKWDGKYESMGNLVQRITCSSRIGSRKPRLLIAAMIITALLFMAILSRGKENWRDTSTTTRTIVGPDDQSNSWLTWIHGVWQVGNN